MLRVGVIGTGHAARGAHIPAWSALPDTTVVALCDSDPSALSLGLDALNALQARDVPARAFARHQDLLAEDLDAVSVCVPNALHFPVALDALRAGKHVFCEKPLCVSVAEARALGAEAEARGLVLMARHQLRFEAAAVSARARVLAGELGAVHHIRVRALRRDRIPTVPGLIDKALAGGGAALDLGVHALDMALWLADFPRAVRVTGSVRAVFGRREKSDASADLRNHWGAWDRARFSVEDFAAGFVHFENGATLALECAWAGHYDASEDGLGCTLFGDKGALHWPGGRFVTQRAEDFATPRTSGQSAKNPAPPVSIVPDVLNFPDFRAFHAAVLTGGPSPIPWNEALASLEILEALYKSAEEGREIVV